MVSRTFRLRRRTRARSSLSVEALSRLTWSVADRKAWLEAYEAALRCGTLRELEHVGAHSVRWDRMGGGTDDV